MYDYQTERPQIFTERGVEILSLVRANAQKLLETAGAFTMSHATSNVSDTWLMLACLDYLVEKGEIKRVTPVGSVAGQNEIFTKAYQ